MKIAYVCFPAHFESLARGMLDGLRSRGHEVRVFYEHGKLSGDGSERMFYSRARLHPLHSFRPDHVIIFNGRARMISGATSLIQHQYKTSFIEVAWLPQKKYIYWDPDGLGGRSSLAKKDLAEPIFENPEKSDEELLHALREEYKPEPRPRDLPKNYILLPLQLEGDTAIRLDSPHFQTMASLISFICNCYKGRNIVVKTHPKGERPKELERIKDRTVQTVESIPMNTLAAYAERVVSINSTSLIEALIHHKPVGFLGESIISSTPGVFCKPGEILRTPKVFLNYTPDTGRINQLLANLARLQFSHRELPEYVENYITSCR